MEVSRVVDKMKNEKAPIERLAKLEDLVENEYTRMNDFEDNRKRMQDTLKEIDDMHIQLKDNYQVNKVKQDKRNDLLDNGVHKNRERSFDF